MSVQRFSGARVLTIFALAIAAVCQAGCVTYSTNAIPANRLPLEFRGQSKEGMIPLNLAALRQPKPKTHLVGGGDLLGIYVYGVIPPQGEEESSPPLMIHPGTFQNNNYYPPGGEPASPSMGVPITVQADGKLYLPLIEPVHVAGLSIQQASDKIVKSYSEMGLLQAGRERVFVTLIKPRVHRVLVIREDAPPQGQSLMSLGQVEFRDRGSASVIDLPAFENDVLHALSASGGLPGTDAYNALWIHSGEQASDELMDDARMSVEAGAEPEVVLASLNQQFKRTWIPLRVYPGEPLPFTQQDIVLRDGDVIYLQRRDNEYFYTGGLLPAGQIPLPRDHDVDILEAIAIATGGVGTPAVGNSAAGQNVIRQGAGLGNTVIPPTQVIIVRKLANNQQIRIRLDLAQAVHEPKERITILPDDMIMLQFKPGQQTANTLLNWFNWQMTFVPTAFANN